MQPIVTRTSLGLCVAVAFVLLTTPIRADLQQGTALQANDPITSIELTLYVGDDGVALTEPVSLDLGLGFPFWLSPIGQQEGQRLAVGATPQEAPSKRSLEPGESAKFVFRRDGEPGSDTLHTTPQLLEDVLISDIARVGIASRCSENWELAGYELRINGELLAANKDVHRKAADSLGENEAVWSNVRGELSPLKTERNELRNLQLAGLASEEELTRLEELKARMAPLEAKVALLEGILRGVTPWFSEEGIHIPGRTEATSVSQAKVTLMTAPHTNAQTYNYLYFITGAKKYFLYPPKNHFTHEAGPQAFLLDLDAGPLTAGDLRTFGLGMLAHNLPYADAPDRWHPERITVEVDGRTTYDSLAEPVDTLSLKAIRLIPPAHVDETGQVRANESSELECFVWRSGQAQGVDLEEGGTLDIEDDPPIAEPTRGEEDANGDCLGSDGWPGEEPIPGSEWPEFPPDEPTDGPGGDPGMDGGWDPGMDGGWDPGMDPGNDIDPYAIGAAIAEFLQGLLSVLNPVSIGDPPQVQAVQLVNEGPQQYRVLWRLGTTGDPSLVHGFTVELFAFHPESGAWEPLAADTALPDETSKTFDLAPDSDMIEDSCYILPQVVAQLDPEDLSAVSPPEWGPALPWLPANAPLEIQPQPGKYIHQPSGAPASQELLTSASFAGPAWKRDVIPLADGTELGSQHTSHAVIVKTQETPERIDVAYSIPHPLEPLHRYRLVGHVGFLEPHGDVSQLLTFHAGGEPQPIPVDPTAGLQRFEVFASGDELNTFMESIVTADGLPETPVAIFGLRLIDDGP